MACNPSLRIRLSSLVARIEAGNVQTFEASHEVSDLYIRVNVIFFYYKCFFLTSLITSNSSQIHCSVSKSNSLFSFVLGNEGQNTQVLINLGLGQTSLFELKQRLFFICIRFGA